MENFAPVLCLRAWRRGEGKGARRDSFLTLRGVGGVPADDAAGALETSGGAVGRREAGGAEVGPTGGVGVDVLSASGMSDIVEGRTVLVLATERDRTTRCLGILRGGPGMVSPVDCVQGRGDGFVR